VDKIAIIYVVDKFINQLGIEAMLDEKNKKPFNIHYMTEATESAIPKEKLKESFRIND